LDYNNAMQNGKADNQTSMASALPWDEIIALASEKLDAVPKTTLHFAIDPANHDQMFTSALESLQKSNSKKATFEEAEQLVERMKEAAERALEARK